MLTVYGLKSCDACRKARKALGDREHRFHDLREDGLDGAMLDRWIGALGWEAGMDEAVQMHTEIWAGYMSNLKLYLEEGGDMRAEMMGQITE